MVKYYAIQYQGKLCGQDFNSGGYPYVVEGLSGAWILKANEQNKTRAEEYIGMFSGLKLVVLNVEITDVSS